ncbi:hypothetical protein D8B26_001388 [Coccidioides posadasii str. Silveira]|uniref:Amine oxidase domain-containing protein n=3 Tax=Coccidioides posadasii TaxID=199306 RepID=E9D9N6_COCPS|nr:amine oxidase, flavin-containing family protein [Coccidioides posadasii C735 delta SOWgp]EER23298.1 amine oxidase, flavin-containing family protein [Coccidioides posadasii C735 delta SOWgp]EFW16617.1 conserved hypothetical protein [Coccidioides posadasii str. Silveira]KMM64618.1 L-amino acid oxidase [Coccidioides posadasii RMSCC 3488]QVM06680.1 hypothetical protein D8B26_001388 [Coccidioides posadasii str. Silveira]|eukprot:XP_003065443.1 amine oxidase, flavin-containing family protein [Coccidioides posadasii C735 delta SOWgp]
MFLDINSEVSIRDQWANKHAIRGVFDELDKHGLDTDGLQTPQPLPEEPNKQLELKVGIIGAGAAGLFTGMIFDYLNDNVFSKHKSHIHYDILEASTRDRVGGRLYTHHFSKEPHDYYDVGAMRFPDNPVMRRVFALFKNLGMEKRDLGESTPLGSLIPYYMKSDSPSGEPWHYNDITMWGNYNAIQAQAKGGDPFQINTTGTIPANIFQNSPDSVMMSTIEPLREMLRKDAKSDPPGHQGWDLLMTYDTYSTRQFLGVKASNASTSSTSSRGIPQPPYNYDTIEWMETFNGGTNWYDQAHSETVLESLDFEFDDETKWYCVLGGAQEIAKRMEAKLHYKPAYESTVTAIRKKDANTMEIDVRAKNGSAASLTYSGVFSSVPLGCLRRIDTSKAALNYATKQAARSLSYGAACKVGIKFSRPWWIHDLGNHTVKGGLGHSDLTIRTCVYPSYNINDPADKPAVLLCSYTWQQDAERIASLFSSNPNHSQKIQEESELKEVLLRDLARLHKTEQKSEEDIYQLISGLYLDHHSFDWYKEPNATGAFGFFRPQQFSSMWNKLIQPSGDFVIIGEAASPHHAWVVGALESAVHGVHAWLGQHTGLPGYKEALECLEKYDPAIPFTGLPPYMDENTSKWHSILGVIQRYDGDDYVNEVMELLSNFDFSAASSR